MMRMNNKKMRLSHSFQRWLIVLVVFAFLATTAFLWIIQTRLSEKNAINLLELNLSDVHQDIIDASDENLLYLTRRVARELDNTDEITNATLYRLVGLYDVTEMNLSGFINKETLEYIDMAKMRYYLDVEQIASLVFVDLEKEFLDENGKLLDHVYMVSLQK